MWSIDLPNTPIPADYHHEFLFVDGATRYRISVRGKPVLFCQMEGNPGLATSSKLLDWIQEVVEGIRCEFEH